MSDEKKPSESEQTVHDLVGETGGDQIERAAESPTATAPMSQAAAEGRQPEHEEVPFALRASNPSSSGEPGLSGDLGISSERTTPDRPRSDGVTEVDFEPFAAPDVSTAPQPEGNADRDPDADRADDDLRASGEPRPAPIADEKNRRA